MRRRTEWWLEDQVEREIARRLDRHLLLDDLSATQLEQLWYAIKHSPDDQLEKALNEAIGVD